ncbi:hypothetical protein C5U48_02760 [Mycolicibacter virginiensis]|uniref:Uncharacterized protein n=2 Tax=Mycolicibacter virginiensis TaxID=1795032 RepID=A0A9X7P049_9MYCO|nr:hypothetical protein C5U48_02760 [Mycolicibacter virginiensis]
MNKAERLWSLRDGVLAWLYGLGIDGATIAKAEPAAFMAATSWPEEAVTPRELNEALTWLKKEGYVEGKGTWQGDILRPHLSTYGEKYAASGKSVRDLPGVMEVQSPYLHIEGSSGVAVALHSPGATQNVNVQQMLEQAQALADAIEVALPEFADDQMRMDAEKLVSEIRAESESETPTPGRLKRLATSAMTTIATGAGTELGKTIIEAALPLLS